MFQMKLSGLTDVGLVRDNNEDNFFTGKNFFMVADGMGGAAAGEIASGTAVKIIPEAIENSSFKDETETINSLNSAIVNANDEILKKISENNSYEGMGTTVVAVLRLDMRLLIGYVGDSRAYLIRNPKKNNSTEKGGAPKFNSNAQTGIMKAFDDKKDNDSWSITRLTNDHSVVMEMVNSGIINEDEIRTHPLRNRITRCLGISGKSDPEFVWHDLSDGDIIIICTDGLWEMVHEDLILAISSSSKSPEEICERLITAAKNSGGYDNITVVTAFFGES